MSSRRERDKRKSGKVEYASAGTRAQNHSSGSRVHLALPPNIPLWNPNKEGVYTIDILPFIVGKGNEHATKGQAYYERTYYVHRVQVGGGAELHTCSRKAVGEKCFACQYTAGLAANPKTPKELLDSLRLKERQLFLLIDQAEPDKGPQIWDISFHLFGKFLDGKLRKFPEYEKFFRLKGGQTLRIGGTEKQGQYKCIEFNDIEFRKKRTLDDIDISDLPCLDECVALTPYKKLKETFLSGVPASAKSSKEDDDDADSDDDDEEGDEAEDDDEDEKPRRGKKKRSRDDDDDDDDEEEDSDEEDEDEDDDEDDSDASEEDDDDEPLTAKEAGIKVGMVVRTEDYGKCKVLKIISSGEKLLVKDSDGDKHKIAVDEAKVVKSKKGSDDPPF